MKASGLVLASMMLLTAAAPAAAEERTWGLGATLIRSDLGVQARKDLWLGGDVSVITVQGGATFGGTTVFQLDADYHFSLKSGGGRFYPLAGLDLSFDSDAAKVMVNVGGGLNFKLTEKLAAFAEGKYMIGNWDGWGFVGGIYF
jgi:hypothetical protein